MSTNTTESTQLEITPEELDASVEILEPDTSCPVKSPVQQAASPEAFMRLLLACGCADCQRTAHQREEMMPGLVSRSMSTNANDVVAAAIAQRRASLG